MKKVTMTQAWDTPSQSRGKKRILIADDEPDFLAVLKKRLENAGYEALAVCSGREALEVARRQRPDLIILDILLPELDGTEVSAALREDPQTSQIPVVFLTGLRDKDEVEAQGLQIGDSLVFSKPLEASVLIRKIEELTRTAV